MINTFIASRTYRILGFICLVIDVIALILVKEKNKRPIYKKGERSFTSTFRFDILKDVNYLLWVLASVIGLCGYFVPYFFLPGLFVFAVLFITSHIDFLYVLLAHATYLGLTPTQGSTLIAIMSASNFVGRIAVGYVYKL